MEFDENKTPDNLENLSPIAEFSNQAQVLNQENASLNSQKQGCNVDIVKNNLARELQTIDYLMQRGMISSQQGLNMLCERVNEARKQCLQDNNVNKISGLDASEFFKNAEYKDVLDYLKSTDADFEDGEISRITDLIKLVEQKAVDRYLRNKAYEEKTAAENELAKRKLSSNAVKKEGADYSPPIFTREAIGKMSSTEFVKNEKAIMDQLRRGLIH